MEISHTPFKNEIEHITSQGPTNTNFGWSALIHYGEGLVLEPLKVISVNNHRNYVGSFTDETTISLLLPMGKYARQIYPNRTKLQITLIKIPLGEITDTENTEAGWASERYTAVLIDDGPAIAEGQGTETNDEFVLDLTDLLTIHFQLFNKSLEQMRLLAVGGVFRNALVGDTLLSMLTTESRKVDVDDERAILGVDMSPVSNNDVKQQIVITHGTKLVDLPDFIQKRVGIYDAGLGSYIQNKYWYIYPLYDVSRFNDEQKTLTVIVLPKRKYSNIERTYLKEGDALTILLTGETLMKDDSGSQYLNQGNGARYTNAEKLMESSAVTNGNKTTISRAGNNSEFLTDNIANNLNHAPVTPDRISANPFVVFSNLNARNGGMFRGIWQSADPALLIPGMVTRILYSDDEEAKVVYGVLHSCKSISHLQGDIHNRRHSTQAILEIFYRQEKM